jgi:cytoskeletal protein CcmA (bactofilin family)
VKGNIVTKEIIVYGKVTGNINCSSLEIRSTGNITGDIKTGVLQVEMGGVHNGSLSMAPVLAGKTIWSGESSVTGIFNMYNCI